MNTGGDKLVTTAGFEFPIRTKPVRFQRKKNRGPALVVKSGTAAVPIYRMDSGGRIRFGIAIYRSGKRMRQMFPTLDAAKKEAQLAAQRIQAGMPHVTGMKPHDRDAFVTAKQMGWSIFRSPASITKGSACGRPRRCRRGSARRTTARSRKLSIIPASPRRRSSGTRRRIGECRPRTRVGGEPGIFGTPEGTIPEDPNMIGISCWGVAATGKARRGSKIGREGIRHLP